MTTDSFTTGNRPITNRSVSKTEFSATNLVQSILAPLASLKLTVVLLVLAVILTFIGTLEQSRFDITTVKSKYFLENKVFVQVPFETFLVPAWFPQWQGVKGFFWVPSGLTILVLMIINMSAAHLLRFRLQATGTRLVVGCLVALASGFFTWVIIFNAQNPYGLQGEPPISWASMWILVKMITLAITCAAGLAFFTLDRQRKYERALAGLTGIVFGSLLAITFVLPESGYIGDPAMRIVWQLGQATLAASISLVACVMLFKRKAGIVLLHLGILGLMANELYVNSTNKEERMVLAEGSTVSHAFDIRSTELAVIDSSNPEFDQFTVIPSSRLKPQAMIQHDDLPFDVKVKDFFSSSDLIPIGGAAENLATAGAGLKVAAVVKQGATGVEVGGSQDIASAYVELRNKTNGESLGTYLVSQYFEYPQATQMLGVAGHDRVKVDGKEYTIELRFKTTQKDYAVTLENVTADYYLGTDTPRHFESNIIFNDLKNDLVFKKEIWMNNPMRYAGETFYQTGYDKDSRGRETSTLQIVTNRGWMIPYVCCMFTLIGLMVQFGSSLLSHLEKQAKEQEKARAKYPENLVKSKFGSSSSTNRGNSPTNTKTIIPYGRSIDWRANWLPIAVVSLVGLILCQQALIVPFKPVSKEELRLDLLGKVPVTRNGRVQPLDSFARHTALQLSKREVINNKNEIPMPAIRWLADSMFGAEGWDEYRLFRVEDKVLLDTLELPFPMPSRERENKSKFKYTVQELSKSRRIGQELLKGDPEKWDNLQNDVAKVFSKLSLADSTSLIFGSGDRSSDEVLGELLPLLEIASNERLAKSLPLVVPTIDADRPWTSMLVFEAIERLSQRAKSSQSETTEALATAVMDDFLPGYRDSLLRDRVIDRIIEIPEVVQMFRAEDGSTDPRQLRRRLEERWDSMPAAAVAPILERERPLVDALVERQKPQMKQITESWIANLNGKSGQLNLDIFPPHVGLLKEVGKAYRNNDAETFNGNLKAYLTAIKSDLPEGLSSNVGVETEHWYNGFAPFYWATALYIAAMIFAMLSWIGYSSGFHRSALGLLILGVSVQAIGLIARIVISGRPPVTNLYSSFLFVSFVSVIGIIIMERMSRLKIGYFLAGLAGFSMLLVAWNMTITDGDTFAVLVAVLDTQFWLATHVVTISVGYAATAMAGFFGLGYVVKGMLTTTMDKQARRKLSNVIYGAICFGLIASFFGTVLGGLWADDSWGRFWGWDPKENGALMIVLWNAVALHARWGGMIRERGLALLSILGMIITLWSWKGVNLLGVGLHAYAGTEDKTLIYMLGFMIASLLITLAGTLPTRLWPSYLTGK